MKYFWRRNGFIFYLYHYFLEIADIFNIRKYIFPLHQLVFIFILFTASTCLDSSVAWTALLQRCVMGSRRD